MRCYLDKYPWGFFQLLFLLLNSEKCIKLVEMVLIKLLANARPPRKQSGPEEGIKMWIRNKTGLAIDDSNQHNQINANDFI